MVESSSEDEGPKPLEEIELKKQQSARKRSRGSNKRRFEEQLFMSRIPSSDMYERSYMHRAPVTHTAVSTVCDFIMTASSDGQLKFWKIMNQGIEFVKTFQAHLCPLSSLTVSVDERTVCTAASDKIIKVFDIKSFDMICLLPIEAEPSCVMWMRAGAREIIMVADSCCPCIRAYDYEQGGVPIATINMHSAPVTAMAYNKVCQAVVSIDSRGIIEYWAHKADNKFSALENGVVRFNYKVDTDLFQLCKSKTTALGISMSSDGKVFAVTCANGIVYVFRFDSGKIKRAYDESLNVVETSVAKGDEVCVGVDHVDIGRRIAVEKSFQETSLSSSIASFDDSGSILLIPSLVGIKCIDINTNKTARILGKIENTERFTSISLYQGVPSKDHQMQHALHGPDSTAVGDGAAVSIEPILVAASFNTNRFYLFTSRIPGDNDRDVFNEKPVNGLRETVQIDKVLARHCIVHTTLGDIVIKLFPDECPRTVENFQSLSDKGYYSKLIFHRVIKGFMVQTGDPKGDGTGGESIWGGEFEDEIRRNLKHDRPFTVSMANAGPNTNGSQFFITTVSTPWLDGKHTVFGRVVRGTEIVSAIENTNCDKQNKPSTPIRIMSITTSNADFAILY